MIALAFAVVMNFASVLVLGQDRAVDVSGEGSRTGASALRTGGQAGAARRPADAAGLHHSGRVAERVCHRPQPESRRGRGHGRHPSAARPAGARRRDRARTGARQESRHPDQFRGRDGGRRHHGGRAHAPVRRPLRRWTQRQSRGRVESHRAPRHHHPGADCGDADSGGNLALARVRRRRRRGGDRRRADGSRQCASQARTRLETDPDGCQPGDGPHVHHQAVLGPGAVWSVQHAPADGGSRSGAAGARPDAASRRRIGSGAAGRSGEREEP